MACTVYRKKTIKMFTGTWEECQWWIDHRARGNARHYSIKCDSIDWKPDPIVKPPPVDPIYPIDPPMDPIDVFK